MNTEPLVPVFVLLMTGLLALLVAATLAHLKSARVLLEEERDRTRAERDAFSEFARRIGAFEAARPEAVAGASGNVTPLSTSTPDGQLRRVKDVYRDTVMAVAHYEEEYDESLSTNMAAEFSEEVATAVGEGTDLTPHLKGALVRQAEQARDQREEFLRRLDREAEDLDDAEGTLAAVETSFAGMNETPLGERSFPELVEAWDRLETLESRCREVLSRRQRTIHARANAGGERTPSMQEYLYGSLPVTHPVLAAGTTLSERLRTAKRRVASAVARRP